MKTLSLQGTVAVVAGASRGAGKGIALALGEAGATVIVTGRSLAETANARMPGGVDETAMQINAQGGKCIAIRCDHTREEEVDALTRAVEERFGKVDLLVSAVWGGNEHSLFSAPFWEQPLSYWEATLNAGVRAQLLTARAFAPLMIRRGRGLIAVVSFDDDQKWLGSLYYDLAKSAMNRLAFAMAQELEPHGIASVALSPGHMRTERVRAAGVDLRGTESTAYVGRAVAALAKEPNPLRLTGRVLHVADLAQQYGFFDEDGSRPARFRIS